jgi:putative Mn2+ efflux pump MntP
MAAADLFYEPGDGRSGGMSWFSLAAVAIALAMDAFAVAIVSGLTLDDMTGRHLFRLSFHFGLFQGLMLVGGWFAGSAAYGYVSRADHWVAFALLAFVGARMIYGAIRGGDDAVLRDPTSGWDLVLLSFATSIDAFAVGLSLAMINSEIVLPAVAIGVVACALTLLGMAIGRRVGLLWGNRVEVFGGIVLIVIGAKILWERTLR